MVSHDPSSAENQRREDILQGRKESDVAEVSVVVPTHNRSSLLALTLQSVLWQRDVDLEIVVVDDGSTDDTAEAVARLRDGRVRIVRHERPQGVAAARNRGAEEATAEWITFLDDDDLWAPDKLARQLQAARDTGRSWAYTGAVSIDDDLKVLGGMPPPSPERIVELLPRFDAVPGGGSNVVVHRDTLARAGRFDSRLRNTEDWEMWIRLAKLGPPAWVCSPLVAKRAHNRNSSLDTREILAGSALIERLHGGKVDRGITYRWLAESCLRTGRRATAIRYFAAAAVKGQARNVASDLRVILRRRIRRHLLGDRPDPVSYRHPQWVAEARAWLDALAPRSAPAGGDGDREQQLS
jgi:glycosyltransferase involved in cell wall biosynthesis